MCVSERVERKSDKNLNYPLGYFLPQFKCLGRTLASVGEKFAESNYRESREMPATLGDAP